MKVSTKDNWEAFWEEKSELEEVYANSERIRENLSQVMDISGKKILEVGAGTGRDSFYMAKDGATLVCLDYSMNSLKIMRKALPDPNVVSVVGGDAFKLPFPDGSFDVVFHQGLLEHFRHAEADALLRENIRILRKGGLIVVDVPQRWHIYTVIKHILIALNAWFAGWEREFSVREVRNILAGMGMTFRHAYGEWMYPSLFYRMFREAGRKIGLKLPLYPVIFPPVRSLRSKIRKNMDGTWLKLNTALSIGIIAEKQ
ncbi:MAG: methyltransferase type 11 [Ectothiorhodospiraceae bacterium]|nr:methyltransferase type 11 [Ectothiorhodospiraceae bacterium]